MTKQKAKGLKILKRFSVIIIAFLVVFVNLSSSSAAYMDDVAEGNKKEQQLIKKIQIIHNAYPQQTDEIALYATLAHRGYLSDCINDSYDPNFDEDAYSDTWGSFKSDITGVFDSNGFIDILQMMSIIGNLGIATGECIGAAVTRDDEFEYEGDLLSFGCVLNQLINHYATDISHMSYEDAENIKKPASIDLLTAATIVMLDSSGWIGTYSDENYKKALAGNGLVGSFIDDSNPIGGFAAIALNGMFCTFGAVADMATNGAVIDGVTSGFNPSVNFGEMKEFGLSTTDSNAAQKLSRYYTMTRICESGYIGGTYQAVQNMSNEEQYQTKKEIIAEEIIKLAEYYRKKNNTQCVAEATGDFSSWKQADPAWGSISLGGGKSMASIGCLITSISMQIARSGTQITNLPGGFSSFNPGAFVTSLNQSGSSFTGGGSFTWAGTSNIAPNWSFGESHSVWSSDNAKIADMITNELSSGAEGKYQKFIVLQIHHNKSAQHWVAVNGVKDGKVTIFDPGSPSGTTLDENYSGWVVETYKVMYATDIEVGSTTSNAPISGDQCAGSTNLSDLLDFVAYVEGVSHCNYKNQGDNTGYAANNEGDGAGMTTAFGITERYDAKYADQVGYSSFKTDIVNGCTDKKYIDQMFPIVMQAFLDGVKADMTNVSLQEYQIYTLASVAYNTGLAGSYVDIADKIRQYGVDSFEVFNCMKSNGCGWTANYNDGLVRRRMAEYEVLKTGNFNAAKPTETYSYFLSLNTTGKWQEYMKSHWPTSR